MGTQWQLRQANMTGFVECIFQQVRKFKKQTCNILNNHKREENSEKCRKAESAVAQIVNQKCAPEEKAHGLYPLNMTVRCGQINIILLIQKNNIAWKAFSYVDSI